jgi:hypothetical protein
MKQLTKTTGIISVAAALLLGLSSLAQADTISFTSSVSGATDWSQPLGLTQFDPTWGTLLSVTIDLSASFSSSFTITNTGGSTYLNPSSARRTLDIYLGSSAVDLAVDVQNPNGTGNSWLTWISSPLSLNGLAPGSHLSANRSGSDSPTGGIYTDITTMGYFTGTGTTALDLFTTSGFLMQLTGGGTSYDSSQTTSATATGIVTYDFTPVPEPSSALFLGFGGLALACYRRFTR